MRGGVTPHSCTGSRGIGTGEELTSHRDETIDDDPRGQKGDSLGVAGGWVLVNGRMGIRGYW